MLAPNGFSGQRCFPPTNLSKEQTAKSTFLLSLKTPDRRINPLSDMRLIHRDKGGILNEEGKIWSLQNLAEPVCNNFHTFRNIWINRVFFWAYDFCWNTVVHLTRLHFADQSPCCGDHNFSPNYDLNFCSTRGKLYLGTRPTNLWPWLVPLTLYAPTVLIFHTIVEARKFQYKEENQSFVLFLQKI